VIGVHKFVELAPFLTARRVFFRLKGNFHRSCVQPTLVHASETWATKVVDMQRQEWTERNMATGFGGVTVRQEISIHELMYGLGVADVEATDSIARIQHSAARDPMFMDVSKRVI
jgi:hypothetical protein